MARSVLPILACLAAAAAWAQSPGSLDAGGGIRTGSSVVVTDALGGAVAGSASSDEVTADTGILPGLPAVTPVDLRNFHFAVIPEGVGLRWEGNPDLRIYAFRLERAVTPGREPTEDEYATLEQVFSGGGPHEYLDQGVVAGSTYYYRLLLLAGFDDQRRLGPWSVRVEETPRAFRPVIHPAYPNPFREAVAFAVTLEKPSRIGWRILDVRGRMVSSGGMGEVSAGYHAYTIRPRFRLPAGIYFLHIGAGDMTDVQKLVVLP